MCWAAGCGSAQPASTASLPRSGGRLACKLPPVAVVKAREALATHLGVAVEQIPFGSHERAERTDSPLGLGGPAESCLAAIHPGWLVTFEVDGVSYEVRKDELGNIIRIKYGVERNNTPT